MIWKYRFYLSAQKKALTKFLKCINWETGTEVRQALALLAKWAPMDVEDALELLNSSFNHPTVRRYAISRLDQALDDDLLLYLLQLVQALKYEHFDEILVSLLCGFIVEITVTLFHVSEILQHSSIGKRHAEVCRRHPGRNKF